jgi:hypothetical protein
MRTANVQALRTRQRLDLRHPIGLPLGEIIITPLNFSADAAAQRPAAGIAIDTMMTGSSLVVDGGWTAG